jgi:hypothetical protein
MSKAVRAGMATTLILGVLSGSADADMTVYYRARGWDAFSGQDEDGKPVCGIGTTKQAEKRNFSLRFQIGSETVTFRAKKSTWNIPAGTQLALVVQIGLEAPWDIQGVGNGQAVEWSADDKTIQTFDVQFRHAKSMTVTFPQGSEPPWTVALKGSKAISNAFGRCVKELTRREVSQSMKSVASTGQATTQPYGYAPVQQREAGASQPFAPSGVRTVPR